MALLPVAAILAVGCSQDDVEKGVAVQEDAPAERGAQAVGVFTGGGDAEEAMEFGEWAGVDVTYAGIFFNADSWSSMLDFEFLEEWRDSPQTMSIGVPMLTKADGGSLQEGAKGAYNDKFRQLGQGLVDAGQGDAVLRIGWEFNGDWYSWNARSDPAAFAGYWRQIVDSIRSVPGTENLRFDWNFSLGTVDERSYPGDDYVDIIGADVYDQTFTADLGDPAARWDNMLNQDGGLNWLRDFAAKHGKPISLPEWGVTDRHEAGPQDNPLFIRNMAEWIRSNDVEYHIYFEFDAPDGAHSLLGKQFPESAKAFQEAF